MKLAINPGSAIAAAAATLVLAGATVAPTAAFAADVKCYGVNACKGQSACKTGSACKGANACKGQGIVMVSDEACKQLGGSTEPKK